MRWNRGKNTLTVWRAGRHARRSAAHRQACRANRSQGCSYTRTTGIWQTVWLNGCPARISGRFAMFPDAANGTLTLDATLDGAASGMALEAAASFEDAEQGKTTARRTAVTRGSRLR